MIVGDRDLFEMWRWLLCVVCAVYAVVVTGRSLWGWYEYLSKQNRTRVIVRKYVLVQLLRLRLRPLARELSLIGFWLILLAFVLSGHAS